MRKPTRREFVQAVTWSALAPVTTQRRRQRATNPKRILAYVGTYSSRGGQNHGQGIQVLEMNACLVVIRPFSRMCSSTNAGLFALDGTA